MLQGTGLYLVTRTGDERPLGTVLTLESYDDRTTTRIIARVRFDRPLRCTSVRNATWRREMNGVEHVVPTTAITCPGFESAVVTIRIDDPRRTWTPAADRFLTLSATFADDGVPDAVDADGVLEEIAGTAAVRFWVIDAPAETRPFLRAIAPVRATGGWDRPVRASEEVAYLAAGLLAAPVRAHELLRFATEGAAQLVSIGAIAAPVDALGSDIGEGLRLPDTHELPLSEFDMDTERGLVPGATYEISFAGASGFDRRLLVAPTQVETGAVVMPWLATDVRLGSPLRDSDVRFVFEVEALRIERPTGPSPMGFTTFGLPSRGAPSGAAGSLLIGFIVRRGRVSGAASLAIELRDVVGTRATTATVPYPSFLLDGDFPQAGSRWPVSAPTSDVPVPISASAVTAFAGFDGMVTLAVTAIAADGTALASDERRLSLDFQAPTLPAGMCPAGARATSSCIEVEQPDDRTCSLSRVCVVAPDVEQLVLSFCGSTRTVALGAPESDGRRCTEERVDFTRRDSPRTLTVEAIDDAGNRSAPTSGEPGCFDSPPRFAGRTSGSIAVARDAGGRPVLVHEVDDAALRDGAPLEGDTRLAVDRWNGGAWLPSTIAGAGAPGWNYRGRVARTTLTDGTIVFCASRVQSTSASTLAALFRPGTIDVVTLPPDGSIHTSRIDGAAGVGCGIASRVVLGDEVIELVYGRRTGFENPRPGLATCWREGAAVLCEPDDDFDRRVPRDLVGLERDVAIAGDGRVHVLGRGQTVAGVFQEYGLFHLTWTGTMLRAGTVFSQRFLRARSPCENIGNDTDVDARIGRAGAFSPRLLALPSGNVVALFARYDESVSRTDLAQLINIRRLSAVTTSLVSVPVSPNAGAVGTGVVRARFWLDRGVPAPVWPRRFERPTAGRACEFVDEEPLPRFDVELTAPDRAHVVYAGRPFGASIFRDTREARDYVAPATGPIIGGIHDLELAVGLRDVTAGATTLVDGPPGPGEGISAFWSGAEGVVLAERPFWDLVYAERRGGQWLVGLGLTGTVGASTCAADRSNSALLSSSVLNLRLAPPDEDIVGGWSSVRTGGVMRILQENVSANITCALNRATEAFAPGVTIDDSAFSAAFRERVGASLASFYSNLRPDGRAPAMLLSRRFATDAVFPAGSIAVRRNGGPPALVSSGSALTRQALIDRINAALGGSAERPAAVDYEIEELGVLPPSRDHRIILLGWPEGSAPPTLAVAPGDEPLASLLGFPRGTARGSPLIDAANGDRRDAFRPAVEYTPCTPGADGTCHLIEDTIDPAVPLLRTAFSEITLREGAPPLRPELGVCVPAEQAGLGSSRNACLAEDGVPHGDGTPADFGADPFSTVPLPPSRCGPTRTPCPPGAICDDDECICQDGTTMWRGRCVDFRSDPNNCGAGDRRCAAPFVCHTGQCAPDCAGLSTCDRACVDLWTDRLHCGACGHECPGTETCAGGVCRDRTCPEPEWEHAADGACWGCGTRRPGASVETLPSGRVRRCGTDADCSPADDCEGSYCEPPVDRALCTHLTREFMGVPAGAGLCAVPVWCDPGEAGCAHRRIQRFDFLPDHVVTEFEFDAWYEVGPLAANPEVDFTPRFEDVRCVMTGCAGCTGATVNGYCHADSECPPQHICLAGEHEQDVPEEGTPFCLLRALTGDGRIRDAVGELGASEIPGASDLGEDLAARFRALETALAGSFGAISVPSRIFRTTGDGNDIDFAIDRVEARIAGAEFTLPDLPPPAVPLAESTDQLVLTLFVDALRVDGRMQRRASDEGGRTGGRFTAVVSARALELAFEPRVLFAEGLDYRAVRTTLLRATRLRGDPARVELSGDDIDLSGDGGVGVVLGLIDFVVVLGHIVATHFADVSVPLVQPHQLNVDSVLDGLGPPLAALAMEEVRNPFVGLMVGSPGTTAIGFGGTAGGTWLENAWVDTRVAGTLSTGLLDLRYRGRVEPLTSLRTALSTSSLAPFSACCDPGGVNTPSEPSPQCLDAGVSVPVCSEIQAELCGEPLP